MRPLPVHPGELLLDEFLLPRGLSQREFAARLGWPPRRLNDLITGRRNLTAESAAELSRALGTSADYWLYLQVRWVLDVAARRKRRGPRLVNAAGALPRAAFAGRAVPPPRRTVR